MQNNKSSDEEKVVEPKENARMVENSDREKELDSEVPPSRWDDWSRRAKHFASNKYNVIIVLLCIVLFVFFIVIIALAARLGSITCPQPNDCRTSQCLEASASIIAKVDYGSSPCQDFYAYSCRGWLQNNPLAEHQGSHSIVDDLKTTIYSRIRHLIDLVPHDADPASPKLKVKYFYKSCMSLGTIEFWTADKITRAVAEIGGWALLGNPPSADWQRNEVLKKLQVKLGVKLFFRLYVEPNDKNPGKNIIKIIPDGLGLPAREYYFRPLDDTYVKAYKEFIKNLLHGMGVKLVEANRAADNIFHYEKRLAEITPEPEILNNITEVYTVMKVRDLDRLSSSISWTDLFQTFFPGSVSTETEVGVVSEKYFADVSKLISSTDNGLLNDYFMWRLISTYSPYMSANYQIVFNQFKQIFEGVRDFTLQSEERWQFCLSATSKYLGHAMGAMYVDKYFHKDDQKQADVYVQRLIAALVSKIYNLSWLKDSTSVKAAGEKVQSMLTLLGYPEFTKTKNLTVYYSELQVGSEFFQNIQNGVYFIQRKQGQLLRSRVFHDYSWSVYPHDVNADYKYAGNQLIVPAGLFESPLFDIGAPLAIKYGVLAGHVANKLSQTFDLIGINYEAEGVLRSWLSNSSLETYTEKVKCLEKTLTNVSLHDINVNSKLCLNNYFADIGGVKLAYEAYKKHQQASEDIGVLPGMNMNNDQLFFVSYAQSLCEAVRPEKWTAISEASNMMPASLRVKTALQQIPEFLEAFSCTVDNEMAIAPLCNAW